MIMGFSWVPSNGSSGNFSSRNSHLHWHCCASVTMGDIWIWIGGVWDTHGGMGKGRDWEEWVEEDEDESGGVWSNPGWLVINCIVDWASSHRVVQWIVVGRTILIVVELYVLDQVGFALFFGGRSKDSPEIQILQKKQGCLAIGWLLRLSGLVVQLCRQSFWV